MPFLIVSTRRVGSTALCLMLNKSKDISCSGEIIYQGKWYPRVRSKHILVSSETDIKNVMKLSLTKVRGCKFTIPEYQSSEIVRICDLLAKAQFKTIHLSRNLLEQYVSLKQAQNTGIWHVKQDFANVPQWVDANENLVVQHPIASNLDEIELFCQRVVEIERNLSDLQPRLPYLKIEHKQLKNPEVINYMCHFLGAEGVDSLTSELQETTHDHIKYINHIQGAVEIFERYEQRRQ